MRIEWRHVCLQSGREKALPEPDALGDLVRREYSDPARIETYLAVGLWPSEEALVDRFFAAGGTVLDIGCGAGRTSIALAAKGFPVTAIDLVPEMIEAAQANAERHDQHVSFAVMDASRLTLDDSSFSSAIFSFNGFEHIPDDGRHEAVLRETWRVLEPGGNFILTARSGFAFGRRWAAWMWMLIRHFLLRPMRLTDPALGLGDMINDGSYHRYRSPSYIRRLLRRAGFEIEYFNSDRNIDVGRKPSVLTNLSAARCLFFVARKPAAASSDSSGPLDLA